MIELQFPPGIDAGTFLRDYWQQRPLLMRQALAPEYLTLEPEELAGFACEEGIESRIVRCHTDARWEIRNGPFSDDDFLNLPDTNWTVLVQDMDKHLDEVAELLQPFRFIPDWRVDDIMISYATDRGGVGPHTDAYDVFLIQAHGKRRWHISTRDYTDADLIPDLELKVLQHFETTQEWVLEPGDILYLPPHVGHWGIAEGPCMTWSVGYRAPDLTELAGDWFQHLIECAPPHQHYRDQPLRPQAASAEISAEAFANLATMFNTLPQPGGDDFRRWFGRYVTEPKPNLLTLPAKQPLAPTELIAHLKHGACLLRHPYTRWAFADLACSDVSVLFCAGEEYDLPQYARPLLIQLCERHRHCRDELVAWLQDPACMHVLGQLYAAGHLEFDDE